MWKFKYELPECGQARADDSLNNFSEARRLAESGQARAADKMMKRDKNFLKEFKMGDNATIRVPDVDRGPSDPRNLLVVILSASEGIYYYFLKNSIGHILDIKWTYFVKFDGINKI